MTKERSPSMQFYFRQFSGDEHVQAMSTEAVGAHILLMCAAGASEFGFKLERNSEKLRRISRCNSMRVWKRIEAQLLQGAWKVSDDGKWIYQAGMERSLLKQKEFAKKQKENAEKRWNVEIDAKPMPDGCQTDAKNKSGMPLASKKTCSSSSSSSSSSNSKSLAPAVVLEVTEPQTAGASPTVPEIEKAIGKVAKQMHPNSPKGGGIRAHLEAGIYRKKIEATYFDSTHAGFSANDCVRAGVIEAALSLCGNRSVELRGLDHGELAESAWAKIAPSIATIEAVQNFDVRSKQVVAVSVRCVVEAALEFLEKGKSSDD